jgi:hypothetical protein
MSSKSKLIDSTSSVLEFVEFVEIMWKFERDTFLEWRVEYIKVKAHHNILKVLLRKAFSV